MSMSVERTMSSCWIRSLLTCTCAHAQSCSAGGNTVSGAPVISIAGSGRPLIAGASLNSSSFRTTSASHGLSRCLAVSGAAGV